MLDIAENSVTTALFAVIPPKVKPVTGSLKVKVAVKGVLIVAATESVIATVGFVLSTTNVPEGPAAAAEPPELCLAVLEATDIPNVPSPVTSDNVIVRVLVPEPDTPTVALAVPVLLSDIADSPSVI